MLSLAQRTVGDSAPHTSASVTDTNNTMGGELLKRGLRCHGHGEKGDLIRSVDFLPSPLASPEQFP